MKRWSLLLHTVRYLKLWQLFYQIYYRIRKPRLKAQREPVLRGAWVSWPFAAFLEPATDDGETFKFLGQVARFEGDWNNFSFPKLWLYNLHYQDDLNAKGADLRPEFCEHLVDTWIAGNPPMQGNGWEPYCLSLRLINWVKYFGRLKPEQVKPEWLGSLVSQTDALEQQLEFHILGNHLFANAKALVFVGVFLGGEQGDYWLKRGLKLLDEELKEQFLDDGAHFELSPMYHATLLWDLADLIALRTASGMPELEQRARVWSTRFLKGLEWLRAMIHPDGEIAFFNDATLGIAPTYRDLQTYGEQLGIASPPDPMPRKLHSRWLNASGYAVIDWPGGHRLLVDVAPVGPDCQPGHAHADTLSFELSLFRHRVLVNSGISQYGDDSERHRQRSTSAHNTVEVDGENSSEVWAGFRVARRARPSNVDLQESEGLVHLQARHDGYKRLPGKVVHHRRWLVTNEALQIEDELHGRFQGAVAHLHFHPSVLVELEGKSRFKASLPGGRTMMLEIWGGDARLVRSSWHPHFGVSMSNQKLLLELNSSKLNTQITWSSF
ncbi:heparinase II/III family protein [Marinobacter salarius]|uniref:heparinase II/III family protein n=1 Tax=Marinobacter salarius TaxID=1420917 RepID=UPI00321315F7